MSYGSGALPSTGSIPLGGSSGQAQIYTSPTTTYYATPDDVARILGFPSGKFNQSTTPSLIDVTAIINGVEDEIDQTTGHAWRLRTVEHQEYYEMGRLGRRYSWFVWQGYPIELRHRKVQPFDTTKGDVFQVMMAGGTPNWVDWTPYQIISGTGNTGRWWADWDSGWIYLLYAWLGYKSFTVRTIYRYGTVDANLNPYPPADLRYACAMRAASILAIASEKWNLLPEGANNIVLAPEKVEYWQQYYDSVISRYTEFSNPH